MAKRKCVLDASAVLRSSLDYSGGGYVMPGTAYRELSGWMEKTALEEAARRGDIEVLTPSQESVSKALDAARQTGDAEKLSEADLDVIALALEERLPILTDDYAIQNTASRLGLASVRTTHDGIKREFTWSWACRGCGRGMSGPGICQICGHKAGKKPKA